MLASSNVFNLLQTAIFTALALVVCVGCGEEKTDIALQSSARTPANATAAIEFRSTQQAQQTLVGPWLGKAVINEDTLKNLLAGMSQAQQQALIKETQIFVSTQMAMQFAGDGSVITSIEITPDGGQPIAGETSARWRVVKAQGNQITVETTERNETGEAVSAQTVYTVSADGNRIAMQPNVASALAQCEPLIFLDRQIDERFANVPTASTARSTNAIR